MIVIFDFDKTLVTTDSLGLVFRRHASRWQRCIYFVLKCLSKVGLISVAREKLLMIRLLFGGDAGRFDRACRRVAHELVFTPLIDTMKEHFRAGDRVIVLSATAQAILEETLGNTDALLIGTVSAVDAQGKITGFLRHPYAAAKLEAARSEGITQADLLYYDSRSDESLAPICLEMKRFSHI